MSSFNALSLKLQFPISNFNITFMISSYIVQQKKMGNDGGDIPKRKQLVKQKKKVEVANTESIAIGRSRFCNLTNQRFKEPLAVCRLGCIYNYENILAALLQKTLPQKYSYIRKLSDIKQVKIQRASNSSQNFIACPITKFQFNGLSKFIAIWTCGHVLSRKAFKEVKVEGQSENQMKKCIICQQNYSQKDIIDLNLQGAELEKRRIQLNKKKNKKKQPETENIQKMGEPTKKVKKQIHINSLERLDGQFRDVIRQREKFKELFEKPKPK